MRSLEELNKVQKFIPKEDVVRIRTSLINSINSGKTGDFTNLVKEYVKKNKNPLFTNVNTSKQDI